VEEKLSDETAQGEQDDADHHHEVCGQHQPNLVANADGAVAPRKVAAQCKHEEKDEVFQNESLPVSEDENESDDVSEL